MAIGNSANLQYTLGVFDSGERYQFGQLNIAPFSFTVRDVSTSYFFCIGSIIIW